MNYNVIKIPPQDSVKFLTEGLNKIYMDKKVKKATKAQEDFQKDAFAASDAQDIKKAEEVKTKPKTKKEATPPTKKKAKKEDVAAIEVVAEVIASDTMEPAVSDEVEMPTRAQKLAAYIAGGNRRRESVVQRKQGGHYVGNRSKQLYIPLSVVEEIIK